MKHSFTVIKPGLSTSVQDQGRSGYYHLGIPPSGALDQYSFQAANLLVGNPTTAAVLECTLMGPQLQFHGDSIIAVAGADMQPSVDGVAYPTHQAIAVPAGATVTFSFMRLGARAYIAIRGGIDVPEVLGSRATYTLGAIGGWHGRTLQAGDELPIGVSGKLHPAHTEQPLPEALRQTIRKQVPLRVMPGLYDHRLSEAARASFYADEWSVASEADRIGYRYKGGRPLAFLPREQPFGAGSDPSNIVDAGYPIGSIQVPSGQEPIILHRDAVSGGGYAMIATVISADMDWVGQMQPNDKARFIAVDMAAALAARAAHQDKHQRLLAYFGR